MARLPPPRPSPESPKGSPPVPSRQAGRPPPVPKPPPRGKKDGSKLSKAEAMAYAKALRAERGSAPIGRSEDEAGE